MQIQASPSAPQMIPVSSFDVLLLPPPKPIACISAQEPVEVLVRRYRSLKRKSAEAHIQTCETLLLADEYEEADQQKFYDGIELDRHGVTARKHRRIGQLGPRFNSVLDRLPASWTTLYAIASLKEEKLSELLKSDILTPKLTKRRLMEHFGMAAGDESAKERAVTSRASMHLPDMSEDEILAFGREFRALALKYRARVSYTAELANGLVKRDNATV